jgi:hypothetical protein
MNLSTRELALTLVALVSVGLVVFLAAGVAPHRQ